MTRHNSLLFRQYAEIGATRRGARSGLTTPELLIAVLILAVLMLAAFSLFRASWQSYDNLVWQTKVNMEARQALDDTCNMLQTGGINLDMIRPFPVNEGQLTSNGSGPNVLSFMTIDWGRFTYRTQKKNNSSVWYLTRQVNASAVRTRVGQFIKSIELEYEFRLPSTSDTDATWRFVRVKDPSLFNYAPTYLATTVYVTVNAEAKPYGENGPVYRRTMTGAVHLRGPHGLTVPPAQYSNAFAPPVVDQ